MVVPTLAAVLAHTDLLFAVVLEELIGDTRPLELDFPVNVRAGFLRKKNKNLFKKIGKKSIKKFCFVFSIFRVA